MTLRFWLERTISQSTRQKSWPKVSSLWTYFRRQIFLRKWPSSIFWASKIESSMKYFSTFWTAIGLLCRITSLQTPICIWLLWEITSVYLCWFNCAQMNFWTCLTTKMWKTFSITPSAWSLPISLVPVLISGSKKPLKRLKLQISKLKSARLLVPKKLSIN